MQQMFMTKKLNWSCLNLWIMIKITAYLPNKMWLKKGNTKVKLGGSSSNCVMLKTAIMNVIYCIFLIMTFYIYITPFM